MYKTTISELGRNKITVTATTENAPDYELLYGMVRKHLMSLDIDFRMDDDHIENGTTGKVVVGGFRPVGNIVIEKEG